MTRRMLLVLVSAVAALTAVAGTAIAGHIGGTVKSYTGCLSTSGGTLTQIAEGDNPRGGTRGSNQVEAHLSGGDITAITAQAGGGLTGGGTNGAVSLTIRRDCANGQVLKWNGSVWSCADDSNSTYTAGTGLDLSSGGEFSVEPSYRLPQTCASGEAAVRNPASGGGASVWTCDLFATANQSCASGQFARGVTAVGALSCAAPSGGLQAYSDDQTNRGGEGIPDDGAYRTYAAVSPPAGTYLVLVSGVIDSEQNVTELGDSQCRAGADSVRLTKETLNEADEIPFALTSITTVSAGAGIALECSADDGADGVGLA